MGILDKLFGREKSKKISEEKGLEIILSKLYKCKNINEELELINSMIEGPKFFAQFDTVDDAKVITTKIPYFNREGTLTYIIPCADGCNLFTGGKISNDEALQVFNTLRDPKSHQKGTTFYDWEPPVI